MKCRAKVEKTKLTHEGEMKAVIQLDGKLPKVGDIITCEWGKTRSSQQNKLYFAMLNIISEETGHTKDELHEFFKHEFLGDKIEIMGEPFIYSKTTTKLKTDELSAYLTDIRYYVQDKLGIDLPID